MKTLILDAVTKSITAVMAGAAATTNPDFTSHYADVTATAFTEAANDGVFNGTTPVTPVAAPAAATRRVIKCITIQNRDTAAVVITLNYVSAGGTRQLWKGTLAVGDTFTLDGSYDNNGNLKTVIYAAGLVTTQHTHAKLVSSNAAVDPALSADAAGALTAAIAPFTLTGGQLKFPAAQNASADVNTLDDYEEGTWAITVTGSTGTAGDWAQTVTFANYTKIGRVVMVTEGITVDNIGSYTGGLQISLPFTGVTPEASNGALEARGITYTADYLTVRSWNIALAHVVPSVSNTHAAAVLQYSALANGDGFFFTMTYHTTT